MNTNPGKGAGRRELIVTRECNLLEVLQLKKVVTRDCGIFTDLSTEAVDSRCGLLRNFLLFPFTNQLKSF